MIQRHHRDEEPQHEEKRIVFIIRQILNIIFMIGAIVGVIFYIKEPDNMMSLIIIITAVMVKMAECALRVFKV